MRCLFSSRRWLVTALAFITALVAALSGMVALHASAAEAAAVHPTPYLVHPEIEPAGTPDNAAFNCQTNRGPNAIVCYSPQQLYQAYGINAIFNAGFTGAGRTIVIIDAFQDPTVQNDLAAFDQVFGLPTPDFVQVAPFGLTPFDPNDPAQANFASEIALDVQVSHAIAPGAKIELVLAKSNLDSDLINATKWAVDHNVGDIISQSFGGNENCVDSSLLAKQHAVFTEATARHITLFASTGDQGAAQGTCDGNSWTQAASTPATDPLVTAIGATELFAAFDCNAAHPCPPNSPTPGTYDHEIALNEAAGLFTSGNFSTGGGFSNLFTRPDWQRGVANTRDGHRGIPDVSFSGSINHGVLASCGVCAGVTTPAFFVFGGTSVGSPVWAGLTALADQMAGRRLGFITEALYKIGTNPQQNAAAYHDTTVGNNTVQEPDATNTLVTVQGFNALSGWDATTGWGTPKVDALLPLLVLVLGGARH